MSENILKHRSPSKIPAEYFQIALDAIKEITHVDTTPDEEARLCVKAGEMCGLSGDWDQVLGHKTIGDVYGLAQVYHNLGMIYVDKKNWESAGEHYQKSMELCIEVGDLDFLSVIHTNRARLALRLHDPSVAKLYCDKAIEAFDKTGNKLGMAEVYKLYGMIHSEMQEWDSAERSLQNGIELCEECDSHLTEAEIHYEIGSMRHKQHLQKAVEIYEYLGMDNEVTRIRDLIWAIAA